MIPKVLWLAVSAGMAAQGKPSEFLEQLRQLDRELRSLRETGEAIPLERYTRAAIDARSAELRGLRQNLRELDSEGRPLPERVDYLLVVARSNELLFEFQTQRPWFRDPMFYLDAIRRIPYREPNDEEDRPEWITKLSSVPEWLELARVNLSEASGPLADIALFHLENYDGVGQGEPLRVPPPEGIAGWYQLLLERTTATEPNLREDAEAALRAVESFRDWLRERRRFMTTPARLGWERYQWYLRNVRLMPYTVAEVRTLGRRELARSRALLEMERRRNRGEPPLQPATSKEEYEGRVLQAERRIRELIQRLDLLKIPEGLGEFETDAFWRAGMKLHFWEEIQYRDAHNNHIHASIPGHRFDRLLAQQVENPIRAAFQDGGRVEGWAYYVEGLMLQSGLLEDRPRARELFYIAEVARAARIPVELAMQSGELNVEQAVREMVRLVPLMEENLARYDLEIYLRRPAYGMNYVMGRIQLEELLASRALAMGDAFDLGEFHNSFLSYGWIPITLIDWEMNGIDAQDRAFWEERMTEFRAAHE